MKEKIRRKLNSEKRKIEKRLKKALLQDGQSPTTHGGNIRYELSERQGAIGCGGIGLMHLLAAQSGLIHNLDKRVEVLKQHRPYHESDHILNIAYNILCGGRVLEDIELRRRDAVFLNALGAQSLPDPTTAGDFCRRFDAESIQAMMDAVNETRLTVWQKWGGRGLFDSCATIDADGSIVPTLGQCKEGMDIAYNGEWGYHPLIISLSNTKEPLYLVNRGGNRPSQEGAVPYFNRAVALCRQAGWSDVLLRGDTAFSLTTAFDRWDQDGVRFVFGYDAMPNIKDIAQRLPEEEYAKLVRHTEEAAVQPREKQIPYKRIVILIRGFKHLELSEEDIVEFPYRPTQCKNTYRMVAVRKKISVEQGILKLFDEYRYFFYITNDWTMTAMDVVRQANERCDQENLIAQLKQGVRSLHAPLNTFHANWAYMVIASLAWTLKAWLALRLPVCARWRVMHLQEKKALLAMEFRTFLNAMMAIPAQIIKTGRRIIYRLLAWNPWQSAFFRLADVLQR